MAFTVHCKVVLFCLQLAVVRCAAGQGLIGNALPCQDPSEYPDPSNPRDNLFCPLLNPSATLPLSFAVAVYYVAADLTRAKQVVLHRWSVVSDSLYNFSLRMHYHNCSICRNSYFVLCATRYNLL